MWKSSSPMHCSMPSCSPSTQRCRTGRLQSCQPSGISFQRIDRHASCPWSYGVEPRGRALKSTKKMPIKFPPLDQQLSVIQRGVEKIVPEDELAARLEHSRKTGTPLRVKY